MAGLFLGIGAGPGIGLSTARRFATEGFRVVLAARKVERLEALADDLRRGPNAGVEIAFVDCSDRLQVAELVDRLRRGTRGHPLQRRCRSGSVPPGAEPGVDR